MADDFDRPTFQEILARVQTDIESRTKGSALYASSVERTLAVVLAKVSDTNHAHAGFLLEEILPTTCGRTRLLQWADALGVTVQDATYAVRHATFTGTGTPTIPLTTAVQLEDNTAYTVTTAGTMSGGSVTVTITADVAGVAGNVDPGATVSLISPIAGVDTDGLIVSGADTLDAVDVESTEDLRSRVLLRMGYTPSGGGAGDYVQWAREVEGVTRAWEFGNRYAIGTVSVGFVRDNDVSIIPDAAEVTEVQDYLDSVRPIDMLAVYVVAPVARTVDMTIQLDPNTAAVQAAVTAQLQDLFASTAGLEVAQPVISKINEAISIASGETDHVISAIAGGAVSAYDPDPGTWGINILGTITFEDLP